MLYAKDIKAFYFEPSTTSKFDFVIQNSGKITPLEIKSGTNIKATSFANFIKKNSNIEKGIRFSEINISMKDNIEEYPLYTFEWLMK